MLLRVNVTLTLIVVLLNMRIKEAHRIASLLEKETKEHFANAEVTVHIEPQCY